MSATARRPLLWQRAEVVEVRRETARARTVRLRVPEWSGHDAGQHVDVRLTTEDGYAAQRSYSIASPPEAPDLELTIERIADGEVSPYFVDEARPGDTCEIRGPIGGRFRWRATDGGPLLLVGGGSGVVPLMAMVRHRLAAGSNAFVRLVHSARTLEDVLYRAELESLRGVKDLDLAITLTRTSPEGWWGGRGRVDRACLDHAWVAPAMLPGIYVCGSTPFVENTADLLIAMGHAPERIRTERFGPTA